jgi:hypothetical protein
MGCSASASDCLRHLAGLDGANAAALHRSLALICELAHTSVCFSGGYQQFLILD